MIGAVHAGVDRSLPQGELPVGVWVCGDYARFYAHSERLKPARRVLCVRSEMVDVVKPSLAPLPGGRIRPAL